MGGVPRGATIVIAGNPGTGKTILATQLSLTLSSREKPAVYTSLVESWSSYSSNMESLGINVVKYAELGQFKFVDLYSFGGAEGPYSVVDVVVDEVARVNAGVLVVDSVSALVALFGDLSKARGLLQNVFVKLTRQMGVTTILIVEVPFGSTTLGHGFEEFISDAIILLRREDEPTRFTLSVPKIRWAPPIFEEREYVIGRGGLTPLYLPRRAVEAFEEVEVGVEPIDVALGRIPRGTAILVVGGVGTGKTAISSNFACAGSRSLYVTMRGEVAAVVNRIRQVDPTCTDRVKIVAEHPAGRSPLAYLTSLIGSAEEGRFDGLVFDGLELLAYEGGLGYVIDFVRSLIGLAKSMGACLLVTSLYRRDLFNAVAPLFDVVLKLTIDKTTGSRLMRVLRSGVVKPKLTEVQYVVTSRGVGVGLP